MAEPLPTLPQLLAPLNQLLAPLLKAGIGNPWLFTPGATVLEVPGRKSGQLRSVPLTCYLAGNVLVIGTARRNSQWIKNLQAAQTPHIWLWGRRLRANKLLVTDHAAWLSIDLWGTPQNASTD